MCSSFLLWEKEIRLKGGAKLFKSHFKSIAKKLNLILIVGVLKFLVTYQVKGGRERERRHAGRAMVTTKRFLIGLSCVLFLR